MPETTNNFELSDDSDCEYETNRRLERRLRSSDRSESVHVVPTNENGGSDGIATTTMARRINGVAKTVKNVVSAITRLNYENERTSYTKKSDLNQMIVTAATRSNSSPETTKEGTTRKGGSSSSSISSILSEAKKRIIRINCYFCKKTSKRRRFELWIVTPCIMALYIILYSDNYSDKILRSGQPSATTVGKSWMEHKLNHHKFENYYQDRYALLADLYTPLKQSDIPFVWSVPFGGTDVLEEIVMKCYGNDTITGSQQRLTDISDILNLKDIAHAKAAIKNIEPTTTPNPILISSFLPSSSSIFLPEKRGRVVTILRDPIHRVVDQYYDEYRIVASQHAFARDDDSASTPLLSLAEYVSLSSSGSSSSSSSDGRYFVDNWLTRVLTDRLEPTTTSEEGGVGDGLDMMMLPDLGQEHLEYAKQILRQKCWVGLFEEIEEFVDWVEIFFQWDYQVNNDRTKGDADKVDTTKVDNVGTCRDSVMEGHFYRQTAISRSNRYPTPGSDLHSIILEKNEWDMQLYWYARDILYQEELGMINFIFSRKERPLPEEVRGNKQKILSRVWRGNEQKILRIAK